MGPGTPADMATCAFSRDGLGSLHSKEKMIVSQKIIQRQPKTVIDPNHGLHAVLARVITQRSCGYHAHLIGDLLPPQTLKNIDRVCEKLARIRQEQQHILVIGDYDCDGATASAIAIKGLKLLGFKHVDYLIPNRFKTGYGLTEAIVDMAMQRDEPVDVLMTVDNGIASLAGVKYAQERGMEVIVTDHHLPGENLPETPYIVNPQLADDQFVSKALCGAGVVFYVLLALRRYLIDQERLSPENTPNFMDLIDLVTLGTVADCVPMDRNNRIMVAQGLRRMRTGVMSVGMQALFDAVGLKMNHLTSIDIAFKIAPKLNAAGRMADMSIGVQCLLSDDSHQASILAQRLCNFNKERKEVQASIQQDIVKQIDHQDDGAKRSVVLYNSGWHQGVIGIIASRVKDERYKPTIIFTDDDKEMIKGSGRSIPGVHLRDVLSDIASQTGILQKFGGHAMAAGLSLRRCHLQQFKEAFELRCQQFEPAIYHPQKYSDGPLCARELSIDTACALADYGLWGQDYPEPVFENCFRVESVRMLKDLHLKLTLNMDGVVLQAMWFFFADLKQDLPVSGRDYRLLYKLSINEYLGEKRLCLFIEYALPVSMPETTACAAEAIG